MQDIQLRASLTCTHRKIFNDIQNSRRSCSRDELEIMILYLKC